MNQPVLIQAREYIADGRTDEAIQLLRGNARYSHEQGLTALSSHFFLIQGLGKKGLLTNDEYLCKHNQLVNDLLSYIDVLLLSDQSGTWQEREIVQERSLHLFKKELRAKREQRKSIEAEIAQLEEILVGLAIIDWKSQPMVMDGINDKMFDKNASPLDFQVYAILFSSILQLLKKHFIVIQFLAILALLALLLIK